METLTIGKKVAAPNTAAVKRQRERLFYTGMAVAFVLVVFAGFARTYYLRPFYFTQTLTPLLHLHGLLFSSWLVLLLAQTLLVATKRTHLHRRLGLAGALLAVLMVLVGTWTALVRAKSFEVPPDIPSPLVFLTIPLGDMLIFTLLVGAAFYYRARADVHKRLMLLATIAILPAAVGRFPFDFFLQGGPLIFFGIPDLFILAILIYDLFTNGRPHRATVLGGLLVVVSHPLRLPVGNMQAWLSFATWLTDLVG
jgi:hypothetical protein